MMTKIITVSKKAIKNLASSKNQPIKLDEKSIQTFSDGEAQMIMRTLAQTYDTDILAAPSLLARLNEAGTIGITKEVFFPSTPSGTKFTSDWIGFKLTCHPSRLGFGSIPKLTYDRGIMIQSDNADSPISIKHRKATIKNFIPTGKTIIAPIQSDEGKTTYLFLTLEEIDAAGVKIKR